MQAKNHVSSGKVSLAKLNRFRGEGFKFTGKILLPDDDDLPEIEEKFDGTVPIDIEDNGGGGAVRLTTEGEEYYATLVDDEDVATGEEHGERRGLRGRAERDLVVIGDDTRKKISPEAAKMQPGRFIGQLMYGSKGKCTATLISKTAVVTAGHCVHEGNGGDWKCPTSFAPGRQDASDPFGRYDVDFITTYHTWKAEGDWRYDVAVISLKAKGGILPGDGLGGRFFPTKASNDADVLKGTEIVGYPKDKDTGTMWTSRTCPHFDTGIPEITKYTCDTEGGMSGSGYTEFSTRRIYGVHAYGSEDATWNYGVVFTAYHISKVRQWANLLDSGEIRVAANYQCVDKSMHEGNDNGKFYARLAGPFWQGIPRNRC